MQFDPRGAHPFARLSAGGEPPSLLKKVAATLVTVAVFVVAMMFSVVLFAVVLTVGAIFWGYLWWKTRTARKRMAEAGYDDRRPPPPSGGLVIEGEVIREVRSGDDGR
ncbi:hypothetical protein [Thauera sinica]|uniref:Uncharacterized protein n=1 Tax=Thauera sinica TaxID=2665146 RepID=A0ABW1AWU8_9RHOO|nr:hypothetical protein [Thauera sp. K11]ATE61818.1 hypothetical protein CCZ27_19260 [Thauera sp. K11]